LVGHCKQVEPERYLVEGQMQSESVDAPRELVDPIGQLILRLPPGQYESIGHKEQLPSVR